MVTVDDLLRRAARDRDLSRRPHSEQASPVESATDEFLRSLHRLQASSGRTLTLDARLPS